jgi:hypothetical protein
VVQLEEGSPVPVLHPRQQHPQQGACLEIERPPGGGPQVGERRGLARLRGQAAEVDQLEGHPHLRGDHLARLAPERLEGGAQDLVPAHHLVQGRAEGREIEVSLQSQGGPDVVERRARDEPVEEPEPFLGEGEGEGGAVPRRRRDRGRHRLGLAQLRQQGLQAGG